MPDPIDNVVVPQPRGIMPDSSSSRLLHKVHRITLCIFGGLIAVVLGYHIWLAVVFAREAASPSTSQVLITRDGRTIPLVQPTTQPPAHGGASTAAPGEAAPTYDDQPVQRVAQPAFTGIEPASSSVSDPIPNNLPPERLVIPSLGLDYPVVLATIDHLPRFRGIGWLFGSTYPGANGNLVLFGHRDGEYGTFQRLPELNPGDIFIVATSAGDYHYRVRERFETTPDHVEVLAPTDTATATLITCTGPWDAAAQSNTLRLIVVGDLIWP